MKKFSSLKESELKGLDSESVSLPSFSEDLQSILAKGNLLQVEGTNVVRVPFGVRQSRKERPDKPDSWATLVLPLNPLGSPPPPPQAA